jgi:type I restriction enzyme M protein
LGDAYEWILRYFAPSKAKEGEIYTPREVIRLLVEVLDPKPAESVYDPACGSAGMLILAFKHVEGELGKAEAEKLFLYGQEVNQRTIALAKMNLYIHDIKNCNLAFGDTFLYPKFKEGDALRAFDVVVANPPWNQDGYDEDVLKKGEFWRQRFGYGFVPGHSADWAWIQHMLASAKGDSGRVGIVIDNGCLFRGGKERAVRSRVLERDLIECVVLLPEKLFYNTGAPGAIIVFRKNKPVERRNKVLFINASNEFEQHPDVRKLNRLGEDHIRKIAEVYRGFMEEAGFSRAVSLDEIRGNDYNLNVTLYVFPTEREEPVDVSQLLDELKRLEAERREVEGRLGRYLEELGYVYGVRSEATKPDLDSTLVEIRERIVKAFDPVKIVLFGSYAWGTPRKDSDLDLLVIMESDESEVKRVVKVSRLFEDRMFPMDILVKTPKEIEERLRIGDYFYKEILEKGLMLYERSG